MVSYFLTLELRDSHWEACVRISKGTCHARFSLLVNLSLEIILGYALSSLEVILCSVQSLIIVVHSTLFD